MDGGVDGDPSPAATTGIIKSRRQPLIAPGMRYARNSSAQAAIRYLTPQEYDGVSTDFGRMTSPAKAASTQACAR